MDTAKSNWYIAYVRSCQERNVSKSLAALGVESYLPIQREWRQWSDRKVLKERLLMPHMVFIHCTDLQRRGLFDNIPYLERFMADRSTHQPVVIPDVQMIKFQNVVEHAPKPVQVHSSDEFSVGQKVKIISGPFDGMECEVASIKNMTFLCVRLGVLGVAMTEIEASCIEKLV